MDRRRSHKTLQGFFAGLTEYTFHTRLGVADPRLVEYVATLLVRFLHCDAVYKVRNPLGRRLVEVAEMLSEAEARVGGPRREVYRHIGDFTLFWAGLYPDALKKFQAPSRKDHFVDYCREGKRSYFIASTLPTEDDEENDVLERLSQEFELCVYGLNEVRREWERRDDDEGPRPTPWLIN